MAKWRAEALLVVAVAAVVLVLIGLLVYMVVSPSAPFAGIG